MAYRANPTDKQQSEIEGATFDQGIPVFTDDKTRVIAKGLHTAPQKTMHGTATGAQRNNAGVVMPHDDTPSRFVGDTQGKS
jgi:hypothetical protein